MPVGSAHTIILYLATTDDFGFDLYTTLSFIVLTNVAIERLFSVLILDRFLPKSFHRRGIRQEVIVRTNCPDWTKEREEKPSSIELVDRLVFSHSQT